MYHKGYKAGEGIMISLRPGFKKFIKQMSQKYEIVVYSREDTVFLESVIKNVDPNSMYFRYYFGNQFLILTKNGLQKDLGLLNRDLDKIVVLDFKNDKYLNNNNNVLYMKEYTGEEEDDSLRKACSILSYMANPKVKDVRKVIDRFGGFEEGIDKFYSNLEKKMKKRNNMFGFGQK